MKPGGLSAGEKGTLTRAARTRIADVVSSVASSDGVTKLWDTTSWSEAGSLVSPESFVLSVAFSPDGKSVLVGHGHFSRVLVSRWLARPATDGVHFAMDAAGWAVLGDERGVPRIDGLNYRPLA